MTEPTTVPRYKTYTVEEYAHLVLDDPKVREVIEKFTAFQKAADKVIDSFEGLVDSAIVKFDDAEELSLARAFNLSTEECKNTELARIIDATHVDIGWDDPELSYDEIAARDASQPHPNATDIPIIVFREFVINPNFRNYLYNGSVSLLSGAYFAKDIDLARQKYLVFATFLWSYMTPKTPEGGGDQYYIFAECCPRVEEEILNGLASMTTLHERKDYVHYNQATVVTNDVVETPGQISHTAVRLEFLEQFKDYIHFDLWNEDDYSKRQKTGTVIRLALDIPETGRVVVQKCGDRGNVCNTTYLINEDELKRLEEEYLGTTTSPVLTKLGTFLRCDRCAKQAYMLASRKNEERYYCDMKCFNRCKK